MITCQARPVKTKNRLFARLFLRKVQFPAVALEGYLAAAGKQYILHARVLKRLYCFLLLGIFFGAGYHGALRPHKAEKLRQDLFVSSVVRHLKKVVSGVVQFVFYICYTFFFDITGK